MNAACRQGFCFSAGGRCSTTGSWSQAPWADASIPQKTLGARFFLRGESGKNVLSENAFMHHIIYSAAYSTSNLTNHSKTVKLISNDARLTLACIMGGLATAIEHRHRV